MFYGWYIVAGVFFSQLFITGFMSYSFGLFVLPLQEEFAASRAEVNFCMTATTVVGLFLAPLLGALADRISPRVLMPLGAVIFCCGLELMSRATNMLAFTLLFAVSISASSLLLGPLVGSTTISRWFSTSRGRALGLAAVGTSVGGLLLPHLLGGWIETGGWRSALHSLALIVITVLLPPLVLIIRRQPEDLGLHPDGTPSPPESDGEIDRSLDMADLIRSPAFWQIGICMGLVFSVFSALMANLVPHAASAGLDTAQSAGLMMVVAVAGLIGKLAFGVAADQINLKLGLFAAIALVLAGVGVLLASNSMPLIYTAAILVGLSTGGLLPVWGALIARVFGVISYGKAMGLMNPVITLLIMPGYVITGMLFDREGNYTSAFYLFIVMLLAAGIALAGLRQEPASQPAAG